MIASLSGIVELRDDPYLIISVNGVGYRVLASSGVLKTINGVGEKVRVFTYTHVREDVLELYGFPSQNDLKLFELLLSVSGIGPKTAISVFAVGSSDGIQSAIVTGNVEFFTTVPRLGRKNAQKIIIELKNKLGSTVELDLSEKELKENKDVIAALRTFGFSSKEAADAVKDLEKGLSTEEKIRKALKNLGK